MSDIRWLFGTLRDCGGSDYLGEQVTQLEHALQCAAMAEAEGQGPDVVLAALFHDIGHLIHTAEADALPEALGQPDHEQKGADLLRQAGMPELTCFLVASHVAAKRYLCLRDPSYLSGLSDASRKTLGYQGGPMHEQEALILESKPEWTLAVRLRRWDDAAKVKDAICPPLSYYESMAEKFLEQAADGHE